MKLDIFSQDNSFTKAQQEQVEQEKIEHKLIGTFNRTKGLRLFSYNILKETLFEVEEIFEGDLYLMRNHEGQIKAYEVGHRKVYINTEDEHFECLNRTNAEKRVEKFKKGLIKDLNNLQKPKNKTISLF
jgi:hypothetical protein